MKKLSLLLALLAGGCVMDLPTGVRVDRPRVLGVRVDIDGDPERAAARPGDALTLRWLVVGHEGDPPEWSNAMAACVARPSNLGIPTCDGAPFAFQLPTEPTAAPSFAFEIPGDVPVEGRETEILVIGVLCAGGTPVFSMDDLPSCEEEEAIAERLIFAFPLVEADAEADANQHPSLGDETLTIDDTPWPASDVVPESGCAGGDLVQIRARVEDEPSFVRLTTSPSDREMYDEVVLGEMPRVVETREELLVTHVATAGLFTRLQTEVFDDPPLEVPWRHPDPEEIPDDGLTVRFWFVARDQRGGMDWVERALCVVP